MYIYICMYILNTDKREQRKNTKYKFAVTLSFLFNQFSNCALTGVLHSTDALTMTQVN